MQLSYYITDANETLILQAGVTVEGFLKTIVADAVTRAKRDEGDK